MTSRKIISKKRPKDRHGNKKLGLGSASPEVRKEVGRYGGLDPHRTRGLETASKETIRRAGSMGGKKRWENFRKKRQMQMDEADRARGIVRDKNGVVISE